jgi:hypothetical protein
MSRVRSCITGLLLGVLGACDTAPVDEEAAPDMAPVDPALAARIEAAKEAILADRCFQERADGAGCAWGDFAYEPSAFAMRQDTREAVLVIDDFPGLPTWSIRYQNRLKGYYRVDTEGRLGAARFSWHAPVTLHQTLQGFASADFRPVEALRELREPLAAVYGAHLSNHATHGSFVLSLLVEANPHQPLVLVDSLGFHRFAPDAFCDGSGSPESLALLRQKAEAVADSLRGLMAEHRVRFVNLSSGVTLASVRAEWSQHCQGPLPEKEVLREKLLAYAPIYEALFRTPGVFTAQSAIDAVSPEANPFDLAAPGAYPNRLRVGFFTALASGLNAKGMGPHPALGGWPAPANVDLYVNTGVLPERPFPHNRTPWLQVDAFGVDLLPITFSTTSWAAPLALSRFIHARSSTFADEPMSDALIARIKEWMVPVGCEELPGALCSYQDPLRYGQTEAVRLRYRPREYVAP